MQFIERIKSRLEFENIFFENSFKNLLSIDLKYVIGRNDEALKIIENNNINGIVDDFFEDKIWGNCEVFKLHEIDKDSLIINCSTSISPNSVLNKLKDLGFENIVNYSDFINFNRSTYLPSFSIDMLNVLDEKSENLSLIYERLSDQISKQTFEDLILFRITCNPIFTVGYCKNIENQYLEQFMNYHDEIFVDAGGFDGDTTELFLNQDNFIKKIYFIEPSEFNLNNAKKRLFDYSNIKYINSGLSEKNEILSFNECNNTASSFSEEGEIKIQVNRLDHLIENEVTFIKMDIEGFELKALKGAEILIKEYKPKLAIAIYHQSIDFFQIPDYVLSIIPNYKLYLRHYTEGWSESVMYFVN